MLCVLMFVVMIVQEYDVLFVTAVVDVVVLCLLS